MNYVPLAKNDEAVVTQYTMTTLEELGLLKMDFLGLRNADRYPRRRAHGAAHQTRTLPLTAFPLEDPAIYQMLSAGQTEGVFQFESAGMRGVLMQLGPESLEDLIAVISLYRPGPMDSIPRYIQNRHNPEPGHVPASVAGTDFGGDLRLYGLPGAGHADFPHAGRVLARPRRYCAPRDEQEESTT